MTVTISETRVSIALANKNLISDRLWVRLTGRIVKDEDMDLALAERIMDQTLGFLRLCGEKTGTEMYSPSPPVDIGWHTFILYTRQYAAFCQEVAGRFIHHNPRTRMVSITAPTTSLGPSWHLSLTASPWTSRFGPTLATTAALVVVAVAAAQVTAATSTSDLR